MRVGAVERFGNFAVLLKKIKKIFLKTVHREKFSLGIF